MEIIYIYVRIQLRRKIILDLMKNVHQRSPLPFVSCEIVTKFLVMVPPSS